MQKITIVLKDGAKTQIEFAREHLNVFIENGVIEIHDENGFAFAANMENVLYTTRKEVKE